MSVLRWLVGLSDIFGWRRLGMATFIVLIVVAASTISAVASSSPTPTLASSPNSITPTEPMPDTPVLPAVITSTLTVSPTHAPTVTKTPSFTSTATPTVTVVASRTFTGTATATATQSATTSLTPLSTATATASAVATTSATATASPTWTPTAIQTVTATSASAAQALTSCGPDVAGYICIDSLSVGGPAYGWDEISGIGTNLSYLAGLDDGAIQVSIPSQFPTFPYYGQIVSSIFVTTNGFITLGGQSSTPTFGTQLPNSVAAPQSVFAFGTDLAMTSTSSAFVATLSNPTRFVVEFRNLQQKGGLGFVTYETELFPNGDIVVQYHAVTNNLTPVVVGIQDSTRTIGLTYYASAGGGARSTPPTDGLAVLFRAPTGLFSTSQPTQSVDSGSTANYQISLQNFSDVDQQFDLGLADSLGWQSHLFDATGSVPITHTATLAAKATTIVTLHVTVPLSATGSDITTITAFSATNHTVAGSLSVTTTPGTPGLSVSNLLVTASCPSGCFPSYVTIGGQAQYKITTYNYGTGTAHSVTVTDTLPVGTTFLTGSLNGNPITPTSTGPQTVFNLGPIPPASSDVLTVVLQVSPTVAVGSQVVNSAIASSNDNGRVVLSDPGVSTAAAQGPNAVITLENSSGPFIQTAVPGATLYYYVTFSNQSGSELSNVLITDTLPISTTFSTSSYSWCNCSGDFTPTVSGNQVMFSLGTIGPYSSGNLNLTAVLSDDVLPGQTITNTIQITGMAGGSGPTSSAISIPATIQAKAVDLITTQTYSGYCTGCTGKVIAGGPADFTITLQNNGQLPATQVVVTQTLSEGLTFASAQANGFGSNGAPFSGTITPVISGNLAVYSMGSLPVGTFARLSPTLNVSSGLAAGDSITSTIHVGSFESDSKPSDNDAVTSVSVVSQAIDLSASVQLTTPWPNLTPGGVLNYSFPVSNAGNTTAHDVVITGTLPTNTTLISIDPEPCFMCPGPPLKPVIMGNQFTVAIGDMEFNQGGNVYLSVRIDPDVTPGTTLITLVDIEGVGNEINPSNNSASGQFVIQVPVVDLGVTQGVSGYCSYPCVTPTAVAGSTLQYVTTVQNNGNATADNVVVTQTLPIGVTFASASINNNPITPIVSGNQIAFSIGNITPGTSVSFYPTLRFDSSMAEGAVAVSATVGAAEPDLDPSNNSASISVHVMSATIDLQMTATIAQQYINGYPVYPGEAVPGETLQYSLVFTNNGNATAQNVVVTDTLPEGTTYVSSNGSACPPCDYSAFTPVVQGRQLQYTIGTLGPATSKSILFTVRLDPGDQPGTTLTNTATITGFGNELNTVDNESTVTITVATPSVDLSVASGLSSGCYYPCSENDSIPGGTQTYSIIVANNGNATAHHLLLTETLPAGITLATATFKGSAMTPVSSGTSLIYDLGDLPGHSNANLSLTLQFASSLTPGQQVVSILSVTSGESDSFPANNSTSTTIKIVAPTIDLSVTQSIVSSPPRLVPGIVAEFQITFGNTGNSTSLDTVITDTFPSGASYIKTESVSCYLCSSDLVATVTGNKISFAPGSLPPGSYGSAHFSVQLANDPPGTSITNTAQIAGTGVEVNPSNNSATGTWTINAPYVDLQSTSYMAHPGCNYNCGPPDVGAGSSFPYSITTINSGNVPAHDVVITTTVPVGTSLTSSTLSYSYRPAVPITPTLTSTTAVYRLNTMYPGDSASLRPVFQLLPSLLPGSSITSTATIGSSELDQNPSDNNLTVVANVVDPTVALSVQQRMNSSVAPGPGSLASYSIVISDGTIYSSGPSYPNSDAHQVVLTDTLPSGLEFVGATALMCPDSGCAWLPITPTVTADGLVFSVDNIPLTQSFTIQLDTRVSETVAVGTTLTNRARVTSNEPNLTSASSDVTASFVVSPSKADLETWTELRTVTSDVQPGASVTYNIHVGYPYYSDSNVDAQNIVVTNTIPSGSTLLSATLTTYVANVASTPTQLTPTSDAGVVVFNVGTLPLGASQTIAVVVRLPGGIADKSTLITTTAISSDTFDPVLSNNSSALNIVVTGPSATPTPSLTPTPSPSPTTAGGPYQVFLPLIVEPIPPIQTSSSGR